ncbi:MAG: protein translocase SEC61 complex subunit gamma, partial [Thermoplasmata archaeon]|jgi:protein transport protein SEC61 subunit gamma-like protein|nr:protein translocase SEC61 complex subunit gamma [Thermoplasmata archaeon]MCI4362057.1 protein translocase SEC61 complex subunit gamma [Thermoplasmata archaeon]MCI4370881.1 protein translocase SEC61 complex subunit gamma [Thermoplasmata archaeon]
MAFLDRARKVQDNFDGRLRGVGHGKFGRVLRMARKPAVDEYVRVLEVTWIGAVLIGAIGFSIYIFFTQIGPWLWATYFSNLGI